jgi:hypothetical protein
LRFTAAAQLKGILTGSNLTSIQLAELANPGRSITVLGDGLQAASMCLNLHGVYLLVMFRAQSRRGNRGGLSRLVGIFALSATGHPTGRKAKKTEPPLTVSSAVSCSNCTITNLEPSMNSLYHAALHQLFLSLSLPMPVQEESVTSLQIGEQTYHLTEHPANYLLMFTRLEAATSAQAAAQNLFSQDPCKPVLAFDPDSLTPVLWSRQPLQQIDRGQIHHQLEQLVHAASEIGAS